MTQVNELNTGHFSSYGRYTVGMTKQQATEQIESGNLFGRVVKTIINGDYLKFDQIDALDGNIEGKLSQKDIDLANKNQTETAELAEAQTKQVFGPWYY